MFVCVAQHQYVAGSRSERVLVHSDRVQERIRVGTLSLIRGAAIIVPDGVVCTDWGKGTVVSGASLSTPP